MARITLEAGLRMISGKIGGFTYRRMADGSLVLACTPAPNPHRRWSAAQQAQIERFRQAGARYACLIKDAQLAAAYRQVLSRRSPLSRLRATVIADILKPPVITALDLSGYAGQPGQVIRVRAEESVAVARLALVIFDRSAGREVETGGRVFAPAELSPQAEWLYQAQAGAPAGHTLEVRVRAFDLAGNMAEASGQVESGVGGERSAGVREGAPPLLPRRGRYPEPAALERRQSPLRVVVRAPP